MTSEYLVEMPAYSGLTPSKVYGILNHSGTFWVACIKNNACPRDINALFTCHELPIPLF
jgi:hypothetical protein